VPEQQSYLMLHRTRHPFIRQQTAIINSIRACLAEFGIVAPVGRKGVEQLLEVVADVEDTRLPEVARAGVAALGAQLVALKDQTLAFDRRANATGTRWRAAKIRIFATRVVKKIDADDDRVDPTLYAGGRTWGLGRQICLASVFGHDGSEVELVARAGEPRRRMRSNRWWVLRCGQLSTDEIRIPTN
jgi:hypothetical protein